VLPLLREFLMKGKHFFDWIVDVMAILAGVLLVGAVLIESIEVVMRYFFHRPLIWAVEVCEYILFSIAFLGAPWLLKKGGHVNVDVIIERISPRSRRYLELVICGIGIFISAVIVWFSAITAWDSYMSGIVVTKTLTVQKHSFIFLITWGYLFLLIEFVRQFHNRIKHLKEK
jgi:TRAP-type C4-dicarboxylate transport system permease small subunit